MKHLLLAVGVVLLVPGCTPAQRAAREKAKRSAEWEASLRQATEVENARIQEAMKSRAIDSYGATIKELKNLKARINRGEKTYQGRPISKQNLPKIEARIREEQANIEKVNAAR